MSFENAYFDLLPDSQNIVKLQFNGNKTARAINIYGFKFVGLTTTPDMIKIQLFFPYSVSHVGNIPSTVIPLRFNGAATANIGNDGYYSEMLTFGGKTKLNDMPIRFIDEDDTVLAFTRVYLWMTINE